MAEDIARLKQLQAEVNSAFEAVYAASDARSLARAQAELVALNQATAATAHGPAFSLIGFIGLVSSFNDALYTTLSWLIDTLRRHSQCNTWRLELHWTSRSSSLSLLRPSLWTILSKLQVPTAAC